MVGPSAGAGFPSMSRWFRVARSPHATHMGGACPPVPRWPEVGAWDRRVRPESPCRFPPRLRGPHGLPDHWRRRRSHRPGIVPRPPPPPGTRARRDRRSCPSSRRRSPISRALREATASKGAAAERSRCKYLRCASREIISAERSGVLMLSRAISRNRIDSVKAPVASARREASSEVQTPALWRAPCGNAAPLGRLIAPLGRRSRSGQPEGAMPPVEGSSETRKPPGAAGRGGPGLHRHPSSRAEDPSKAQERWRDPPGRWCRR